MAKTVSLQDLKEAVDQAIALCAKQGLSPKEVNVQATVVLTAKGVSVFLDEANTVWFTSDGNLEDWLYMEE